MTDSSMLWHGILLSETARLAPAGSARAVTGGVLSFGQVGALLGPVAFSLLLRLTSGYGAGWGLCTIRGWSRDQPVAPARADRAWQSLEREDGRVISICTGGDNNEQDNHK